MRWRVTPTCWQLPYWSLVDSVSLCCQSMFLMSFWLCNALRSNTSQSNLSWHCVQLIWQSLGSLFLSKVVIFLMSWNPCLGVDASFADVLCYGFEFWKDSAFQFHVSYGSGFQCFVFHSLCPWATLSLWLIISVTPKFKPCWSYVLHHRMFLHNI